MLIIFSGFNQRAVIAILRNLKKNKIEEYRIIACGKNDPIINTAYSEKIFYIRNHQELVKTELYPVMKKIVDVSGSKKVIIVPSTEYLNRFIVENRDEIENLGVTIPLVDNEMYSKISDKRSFYELCKENGLKVPKIVSLSKEYRYRYVAKPVKYISQSNQRLIPLIVDSEEKHLDFLQNYNQSDFDIQEYVDGESIYLLYYLSKTGGNYSFSQRNLVQQPFGKSMVVSIAWNTHKENIANEYIDLFRQMGFYGFIMVELRKKNGEYYMIEANPRMWGPSQLYVDAGVPFIEAFLVDYGEMDKIPDYAITDNTTYFWSGGIQNALMEDSDCVWLEGGKEIVQQNYSRIINSDIYNRQDTIEIYKNERTSWEEK